MMWFLYVKRGTKISGRIQAMIKSPLSQHAQLSLSGELACCNRIGSSKGSPTETLETIAMSTDWVRFLVRNDSE